MTGATRPATVDDLGTIRRIGVAAGRRFATVADPRIAERADDDPLTVDDLRSWIEAGRAWVADEGDGAVGFVVADVLDGNAHVEEISVHPDHEGRGHGGALLDAVSAWARAQGMAAVTLTTFSDVEWNRPYYERRGYRVLAPSEVGPELQDRIVAEERAGLPAAIRVCMARSV